jgi:hypothetical protein
MPASMKCAECGKVKRCRMIVERGEDGRDHPVYYCLSCKREIERLKKEGDDAQS